MNKNKATLVIGVLKDTHIVGSKLLAMVLEGEGFHVVHIGAMVTQDELIKAAIETDAKAILVSTSSGHGELDCDGLREKCMEVGLKNILLYAGGNVVISPHLRDWKEVEKRFKEMGFNRVYPPGIPPEQPLKDLQEDLGQIIS